MSATNISTSKRHRVQLDFSDEAYRRLAQIRDLAGTNSNSELVRDALRVYEWMLLLRRSGKSLRVVSSEGDNEERVELLF